MIIELWPIDKPIPYARNARTISATAVDKVAASIKEFGWRQPIVVDTARVIIAGHTRLLAARKLGLTEVPVHVAENLTPGQVKAYRLADNRTHDESSWDFELLGPELLDLQNLGFGNLELTGFDPTEIDDFLAGARSPGREGLTGRRGTARCVRRLWRSVGNCGGWASTGCCAATRLPRETLSMS